MNIEIVDFYPDMTMNEPYIGTLHVYLVDLDIDLRGIKVAQRQTSGFAYHVPDTFGKDPTGKKIRYPIWRFTNKDKQTQFLELLHKIANPYISEAIRKKPLPRRPIKKPMKGRRPNPNFKKKTFSFKR